MKLNQTFDIEAILKGKKYDSLDALMKVRKAIGPARFYMMVDGKKTPLTSELNGIYGRLSNILDKAIVEQLGGTLIKGRGGKGAIADFLVDGEVVEGKAISTTADAEGTVTRAREISVAGGLGVKLTGKKDRQLITGVSNNELTTEGVRFSKSFVDELVAAKNNQAELKRIMSDKSGTAAKLRKNFMLKSADIRVPIMVGNKKILKAISFNWKDIKKNKNAKIKITVDKRGDVFFNIYFTEAVVRNALNKGTKKMEIELKRVSAEVAKSLGDEFAQFSPKVMEFLGANKLVQTIEYDKGSALIGKGSIKRKKGRSGSTNRFISGAQLTAMLQKLMRQKMPKGPRRGPPLSDDVLTERTGRFRRSTTVIPNYRQNMIRFMYDPIYKTFIDTPRNPDELIESSLREIVQKLFSRQFKIVRGN